MAKKSATALVTVRVVGQSISEEQGIFHEGETFENTPERAEAIGVAVEIVAPAPAPKPAE